jgi:short-subunit dehydrogenase
MQTVFITGGTTGLGLELAREYIKKGYKVGICARDQQKYDQAFPVKPAHLHFYPVDVADKTALQAAIKSFSSPIGLNLLIANAGISYPVKTKIPDFALTYKMIDINLKGVIYAFEAALEVMIPQGKGQLVAISSLAGFNGFPGTSGYSASKAAVMKFCESLSLDLKGLGIDVTCICPGFVDTPLTRRNQHPMPFLMNADKATQLMLKAIEKKPIRYSFPFRFYALIYILSIIPRSLFAYVMSTKGLNYSKEHA